MKYLLITTIILLLLGCSSIPKVKLEQNFNFTLGYSLFIEENKKADISMIKKVGFAFPSIPGRIFGNPSQDMLFYAHASGTSNFSFSLPNNMEQRASKLKEVNLEIFPSDTELARLGTFHYLPSYEDSFGGGGFQDKKTGNHILLVYFSKKSLVTGELLAGNDLYKHDISVRNAGWHWLEIIETGQNHYKIKTFIGDVNNIEFIGFLID